MAGEAQPQESAEYDHWSELAACDGEDPELFFYFDDEPSNSYSGKLRRKMARKICLRCPVIDECGAYALENEEEFGTWGGVDETERRAMLRRRA